MTIEVPAAGFLLTGTTIAAQVTALAAASGRRTAAGWTMPALVAAAALTCAVALAHATMQRSVGAIETLLAVQASAGVVPCVQWRKAYRKFARGGSAWPNITVAVSVAAATVFVAALSRAVPTIFPTNEPVLRAFVAGTLIGCASSAVMGVACVRAVTHRASAASIRA